MSEQIGTVETVESQEEFLSRTEILRTAITKLVSLFPDVSRPPDTESEAMAELADEKNWLSPDPELAGWGPAPITLTHHLGSFQYDMAMDCALGMVRLIENTDPGLIWSPAALFRPVLEGAARSYWLSQPGIGIKERLRRGVNDRLEALFWQKQLGPDELVKISTAQMDEILKTAPLLGYELGKRFLQPARPSTTDVIGHMFDEFSERDFANLFMMYSSAFVHAGPQAVLFYTLNAPQDLDPLGQKGAVALTDRNANIILAGAIGPLVLAGRARLQFNKWESPEWSDTAVQSLQSTMEVTAAYRG